MAFSTNLGLVTGLSTRSIHGRDLWGVTLRYVSRRWPSWYSWSHARVVRRIGRGPAAVVTVLRRPVRAAACKESELCKLASLLASTSVM